MFGRFVALRHLALDVFLKNNDPLGSKTAEEILKKLDQENISYAKKALELVSEIESKEPGYFDDMDQGDIMVNHVCIVNECLQPGSVQETLGWTKLAYFGPGRNGLSPESIFDESDNALFKKTVYTKIKPDKIIKSSVADNKCEDENHRQYIDYFLMEKDYNDTETFGDANMLYGARIFGDGVVLLSTFDDSPVT